MELTRRRLRVVLLTTTAVLAAGLYLFLYGPLFRAVKHKGLECRMAESKLAQAREFLARSQASGVKKKLIHDEEISIAIDELSRRGREDEINFVSITPKTVIQPQEGAYRILPIDLETESTYESLGGFLGFLDELRGSLVSVWELRVAPKPGDLSKLVAHLTLHLYLAGESPA